MGREVELKFDLSPQAAERLRTHPLLSGDGADAGAVQTLRAVYFDTDDEALRRAGLSLRIRDEAGLRLQTVKSSGGGEGLLARGEWEAPVEGDDPDLARLAETPLGPMLKSLDGRLRPMFQTRVERMTRTVHGERGEVELSLDAGEVTTTDRRAPLHQLEIELKQGTAAALFEVARTLAVDAPLRLSFETKAGAGYGLLHTGDDPSVKAEAPKIAKEATAAAAFQAIVRACLVQLTANQPVLQATRSPKALHQMRIALRRLRAALSTFAPILAGEDLVRVKDELRWLSGEFNTARNLDVFLEETIAPAGDADPQLEGLGELAEAVRLARTQAYDGALRAVEGARYRAALLETAAWAETGAWITTPDEPGRSRREAPAVWFAAEALQRRRRTLKKRGRGLADMQAEDRHDVRIAAKKMRYAAEFFAPLFDGKKARKRSDRFIDALKALQDELGKLNDIATGPETAAGVLLTGEQSEHRARAIFAAGRIVGARAGQEAQLIKAAERAHARFAKAKPFW